jgi:hypothetical protein
MKPNISMCAPIILAAMLQANLVLAQKEVDIGAARPHAPKTVTLRIVQSPTIPYPSDKLADTTAVLYRRQNSYTSSPIRFDASEGVCTFEQVVPGKYRLELTALDFDTSIQIPDTSSNELTLLVHLNRGGITVKVMRGKS